MSRYISFRDFDWVLLIFVLLICGLGVMEIQSATVHTKFAGAHIKQVYWVLGGVGGMFLVAKQVMQGMGHKDYRTVFNCGAGAQQSVFHLHLHVLAGRKFTWPPG